MSSIDLYAADINSRACRMIDSQAIPNASEKVMTTAKIGIYASMPTLLFLTNPVYHLSGFLAILVNRLLDNYSSYQMARQFERKEFFEYGLDKLYYESNPLLGKHPTRKKLLGKKSLVVDSLGITLGTVIPPFGYGMLLTSYRIYKQNMAVAKSIGKAIEIGDEVKKKIGDGVPEEDIRKWLQGAENVDEKYWSERLKKLSRLF